MPLSTVAELRAKSCCASVMCTNVVRAARCTCCDVANRDEVPLKQVMPGSAPGLALALPSEAASPSRHVRVTGIARARTSATGPPTYLRLHTLLC
jgi:hypothetical protein